MTSRKSPTRKPPQKPVSPLPRSGVRWLSRPAPHPYHRAGQFSEL